MNQPEVGGFPLYMSATGYDPGARLNRIKTRIEEATAGGKKLDRDGMSAIQADAKSDWGKALQPTLLQAAKDLAEENATPGAHPEVAPLLTGTNANVKTFLNTAKDLINGWTFDTPSATSAENPSQQEIADSKATLIFNAWVFKFMHATFDDELADLSATGSAEIPRMLKMLVLMCNDKDKLKTKDTAFNDGATAQTKGFVAAKALVKALEALFADKALGTNADAWRWGTVHTLTPTFFLPLGPKQKTIPRHGMTGTVDVASPALVDDVYTFDHGPAIRFVAELDPQKGPVARNAIPGGEMFDPAAPHYSDFYDLWSQNKTFELPYLIDVVADQSKQEAAKNNLGRRRFEP
jgi:acyl-homoserine lactone acylase PvdQ